MKYEFFVKDLGRTSLSTLGLLQLIAPSLNYKPNFYFRDSKSLLVAKVVDSSTLSLLRDTLFQLKIDPNKLFDVEIDRLEPFSYIGEHKDTVFSPTPATYHKLHLPIITNDKCGAMWNKDGKQTFATHLKEGHVYLFNNIDVHSVVNLSSSARYHVILRVKQEGIPNA